MTIKRFTADFFECLQNITQQPIPALPSTHSPHSPKKLAIALSGGADSMCLAFLMSQIAKEYDLDIVALIVDHKIRSESTIEALHVQKEAENINIDAVILTWEHSAKLSGNIMSLARQARYQLMSKYCDDHDIRYLLVAHNQNDQAETVLQRLVNGASLNGLCGIKNHSSMFNLHVLRPLLKWQRSEIEAILLHNNIKWVEDPSNRNERFDRVKARNLLKTIADTKIVPNVATLINRLSQISDNANRAMHVITLETSKAIDSSLIMQDDGSLLLNVTIFITLQEEIALRLLKHALMTVSEKQQQSRIRLKTLENCLQRIRNTHAFKTFTCCFCILRKVRTNASSAAFIKISKEFD